MDRMTSFGNMFIMRPDGSDREGVCDTYEEALRCTRCDEGAGVADQVRGLGKPTRCATPTLQGIADRHSVQLDRRYGGYREWHSHTA